MSDCSVTTIIYITHLDILQLYPATEGLEFLGPKIGGYSGGLWILAIASSSCLTILYTKSFVKLHERKKCLTIPILSANFLLWGRVFLLTRVPSGYNMKQRGFPSFSASLPKNAKWVANCCRSEAQERARKIKLKNCMPWQRVLWPIHWEYFIYPPSQGLGPNEDFSSELYRHTGGCHVGSGSKWGTRRTTNLHISITKESAQISPV